MNESITPCLWFDGQAKEAGELYCSLFEQAKLVAQSPVVTEIEVAGQHITLLDGGPMYQPNPSISLFYTCDTEEEINSIWSAFAAGGQVLIPLDTYDWSPKYGWITDQYGISWQLALGNTKDAGQKIIPCLLFVGDQYGRVEEAIQHYTSVFRTTQLDSILHYGSHETPDQEGMVKQAQLDINGQKFRFMESAHPHPFGFTEGVSLTIHCETQEEIDYYWTKLTEQGEESMCGWLKDRFGVSWQVIPTILSKLMSEPEKAGKAAQAFMEMRKLDIEKIVQATLK